MPAPELTTQTPGEPLTPASAPASTSSSPQAPADSQGQDAPVYIAKHNGGGRWKIWHTPAQGDADWFSDFVAIGDGAKEKAEAEAQRLLAGGEPLTLDPERLADKAALAKPVVSTSTTDATTLKQPVMTAEGWLCPEPAAKE